MMAGILMLELAAELRREGQPLSSVLDAPRGKYFESGEINFQMPADRPAEAVIAEASEQFSDEIDRMYVVVDDRVRAVDSYPPPGVELSVADLRAEAEHWWFCMRKSGTEGAGGGILRLYVEAFGHQNLMQEKRDSLVELAGPELRI
jgi:phosphomannomutase